MGTDLLTRLTKRLLFLVKKSAAILTGRRLVLVFNWYDWVRIDYEKYLKKTVRNSFPEIISRFKFSKILKRYATKKTFPEVTRENFKSFGYNGFSLWEICKSSILDHLIQPDIQAPEDLEIVRSYYEKSAELMKMAEKLFDKRKPFAILVEQGFQYDMRTLTEVARRQNIRTIAVENSFIKDHFFMDAVSGGICNRHFLSRNAWDILRGRDISDEQRREVRSFMRGYTTQIRKTETPLPEDFIKRISGRKVLLVLGQVATDASIIMDSPLYPDMSEFLMDVATKMEKYRDEWHTVIRLHPKEAWGQNHHGVPFNNRTLKNLLESGIGGLSHVTLFHSDQADTYELMDLSDLGITINSQSGIEMLSRHKPVIIAGDSFYSGKGFTFDIRDRRLLGEVIRLAVKEPVLSESQKRDIDKFIAYMIHEYLYPVSIEKTKEPRELQI